ncbi:MAG: 3-deoxy-7-phosphoheptulonate synthase [Gemmataceae bacterium]
MQPTQDLNIVQTVPLVAPRRLTAEMPMSDAVNRTVVEAREHVKQILDGRDRRLLVIVGPCSIHDPSAALDYARRLRQLARDVADRIFLVMRVYFEKPRTTVGWKGLINDPHLNDTFDMATGLRLARQILLDIGDMGLPAGTEMLEPITPQYIADLVTWASIGARTTESPTHRQMASGLSMPVGFKNGTDGNLQSALDAMLASRQPHRFLGIDPNGSTCIVQTKGNSWGHLILRGGRSGTNYAADQLRHAASCLEVMGLPPRLMVDCSHANSDKDYRKQEIVWNAVIQQRLEGNDTIIGLMLESNLHEGNQKLTADLSQLRYGVSITDSCIDWPTTERLIRHAYDQLPSQLAVR